MVTLRGPWAGIDLPAARHRRWASLHHEWDLQQQAPARISKVFNQTSMTAAVGFPGNACVSINCVACHELTMILPARQ